jgi:hypothetical protein
LITLETALSLLPITWASRLPSSKIAAYQDSLRVARYVSKDYWDYLKISDGGEGKVAGIYLSFWTLGEVQTLNSEYGFQDRMHPNICAVGTTDDAFVAHDFRSRTEQWVVFPFGDFDLCEVCQVSKTFPELIEAFANSRFPERATKLLK